MLLVGISGLVMRLLWRGNSYCCGERGAVGSRRQWLMAASKRENITYRLVRLVLYVVYCLMLKYPKDSLTAHPQGVYRKISEPSSLLFRLIKFLLFVSWNFPRLPHVDSHMIHLSTRLNPRNGGKNISVTGLQDSGHETVSGKQYIHFSSSIKSARMHCSQGSRSRAYI